MRAVLGAALGLALLGAPAAVLASPGGSHPVAGARRAALPRPDHVLIVMLENKSYDKVIGNRRAPYLNKLARTGANFTAAWAETHPSQPNYLALFAGTTAGVTSDHCVDLGGLPNLGRQLLDAGLTFTGYAEDQPYQGFAGCRAGDLYVRRHAPWNSFANLPARAKRVGSAFPWGHLGRLPTVAWYTPNMCHIIHDCNLPTGDAWLAATLPAYVSWAATHNSLLIVTFDEAGHGVPNHIPTFFLGPMVRPGNTGQRVNHYSILRTIEDMYGLPRLGRAATAAPVGGIWRRAGSV
jgi:phosphatidylinositol-3-phosphatase